MASNSLKIRMLNFKTITHPLPFPQHTTFSPPLPFPGNKLQHGTAPCFSIYFPHFTETRMPSLCVHSSISSSTPPGSREEAIQQAKTCLSATLEKPLNNPTLAGKLKKLKQPRFQVEIPVMDDSPTSLSQLVLDVFNDLPIKRKGSQVKTLILWPNLTFKIAALEAFQSLISSNEVEHSVLGIVTTGDNKTLSSADLVVFSASERSQLPVIKSVCNIIYPKPVVMFNPRWEFEEESDRGELDGFVRSFEVIYSFVGLEVQGILSKRKGVVFRCVRDGVVSGEKWSVFVEEEGKLKVVSRFKDRPSIGEVENVLYNLMAVNSPITKSAKFLKELVSNVTGRQKVN